MAGRSLTGDDPRKGKGAEMTGDETDDTKVSSDGPPVTTPQPSISRRPRWPTWIARPSPDVATRLVLLALALALQNLLELPRDPVIQAIGAGATSVLVVAILAASLVLVLAAVWPRVPGWRWPRLRWVCVAALVLTLGAAIIGVKQVGGIVAASFGPPFYTNDGTTLDHYAAQQLLDGHNPYVSTDIVAAVHALGQDAKYTTPLHQGAFAARPWTDYPPPDLLRQLFPTTPGTPTPEFESHVSYPALAFLPLVPLVWAGLPSVVLFFALCLAALAVLLVRSVPPDARFWVALLILADVPILNATLVGVLDVFYILLLFVAWRWLHRPVLSAVFLGLAVAAKQLAWYFVPFYALYVWRRYGWRAALARLAGAAAIFLAINAPFIIASPGAWLEGVLAPVADPMFPLGSGLVRLALGGLLPLAPSSAYTMLELLVFGACLIWVWRRGGSAMAVGFVLAVVPLFFAWRSLTTYFYFVGLPALVIALSWKADTIDAPDAPRGGHVPTSQGSAVGRMENMGKMAHQWVGRVARSVRARRS